MSPFGGGANIRSPLRSDGTNTFCRVAGEEYKLFSNKNTARLNAFVRMEKTGHRYRDI